MKIEGNIDINTLLLVVVALIEQIGKLTALAHAGGATDEQLLALDAQLTEAIDRRKAELS